jgi:hypothetical protein
MSNILDLKYRLELKFVSNLNNLNLINMWLKLNSYLFRKEYEDRLINNVYFDTFELNSLNSNVLESLKRFKIRYRWFGNLLNKNGSLEIKNKINKYGWKDRYKIKDLSLLKVNSWKSIVKLISSQVPHNVKYLLNEYRFPVIINQYLREYYISKNKKFRITIDTNIKNFSQFLSSNPNLTKSYSEKSMVILEVKFLKRDENEIKNLLSQIPIRNSKNSKYLNGFNQIYDV